MVLFVHDLWLSGEALMADDWLRAQCAEVSGMNKNIISQWTITCPDKASPSDSRVWSLKENALVAREKAWGWVLVETIINSVATFTILCLHSWTFYSWLQPVHTVHRQQHCIIRRTRNTRLRRDKATLSRRWRWRWLKVFSCPYYLDKRIETLGVPNPSYLNRYRAVHQMIWPLLIWSRQGDGKLTTCQKKRSYCIKFFPWLNIL